MFQMSNVLRQNCNIFKNVEMGGDYMLDKNLVKITLVEKTQFSICLRRLKVFFVTTFYQK